MELPKSQSQPQSIPSKLLFFEASIEKYCSDLGHNDDVCDRALRWRQSFGQKPSNEDDLQELNAQKLKGVRATASACIVTASRTLATVPISVWDTGQP